MRIARVLLVSLMLLVTPLGAVAQGTVTVQGLGSGALLYMSVDTSVQSQPMSQQLASDELNAGEVLQPGEQISSDSGDYYLVCQLDGNLVLYRALNGEALWASETVGPVGECVMQDDGNLVIYGPDGEPVWASHSGGNPGSSLFVQDDGNLVIYDPDGLPIWASNTVDTSITAAPMEYGPDRSGPRGRIEFYMSDKERSSVLDFEEIDSLAVTEGDIVLGRVSELEQPRTRVSEPLCVGDVCQRRAALSVVFGESVLWPGGIIPYEVNPGFGATERGHIENGIALLNDDTNLIIRPRNGERDYVVFVPSDGCASFVGRQHGAQNIWLHDGACSWNAVAHEILHAAGLWHEQSRSDRDFHVTILWENIQEGKSDNFAMHATDGVDVGPYDLQSIMHYGAWAFGKADPRTGQAVRTIETVPPGGSVGGSGLSPDDLAGIDQIYTDSESDRFVAIPGLVFGLRHSINQANDFVQPIVGIGNATAQPIHGGDLGAPSGQGYNWWTLPPEEAKWQSVRPNEVPLGVVMGMWHSRNMQNVAGDLSLETFAGGDLGAPAGVGFVWYENTKASQVNWDLADLLPPYTVVGLKHSANQKDKTFLWKDGQTYDPLVACPPGFDRKHGGDRGASSGVGFYWCEWRP